MKHRTTGQNLPTTYFKQMPWLEKHMEALEGELDNIGVALHNWYSSCCSTWRARAKREEGGGLKKF